VDTVHPMTKLDDIAERDGWRCWLCDEPVDPAMSVNDPRGASVDTRVTDAKAKSAKKGGKSATVVPERLAHRGCNTRKGAVAAVVPWAEHLFVADPAPILTVMDRLGRKGGREIMARCPSRADAEAAADWLADRLSRLVPELEVTTGVEPGGQQFMVVVSV
jgi:hypothetical protein